MSNNTIEELKLGAKIQGEKSRYRTMVIQIIQYFKDNPNKRVAKITCKVAQEANGLCEKLRAWMTEEEEDVLIVTQRGRVVYLLRDMNEEI